MENNTKYQLELGERLISTKRIVYWPVPLSCLTVLLLIALLSFCLEYCGIDYYGFLQPWFRMPEDILSLTITFGMVSVSVFPILVELTDIRILGMSYKAVFFKEWIWKYWNYPNTTGVIIEMMIVSIILEFMEKKPWICITQSISLISVVILCVWLVYLTFIASVKRSRIYVLLKKNIETAQIIENDSVIKLLLNRISRELKDKNQTVDSTHNPYVYEDIGILFYLAIIVESKMQNNLEKAYYYNNILEKIDSTVKKDSRDEKYLIYNIKKKAEIEFRKYKGQFDEICKDLSVETKIDMWCE